MRTASKESGASYLKIRIFPSFFFCYVPVPPSPPPHSSFRCVAVRLRGRTHHFGQTRFFFLSPPQGSSETFLSLVCTGRDGGGICSKSGRIPTIFMLPSSSASCVRVCLRGGSACLLLSSGEENRRGGGYGGEAGFEQSAASLSF